MGVPFCIVGHNLVSLFMDNKYVLNFLLNLTLSVHYQLYNVFKSYC